MATLIHDIMYVMYIQSEERTKEEKKPNTFLMTHESKMKNLLSIVFNITFSLSNTTHSTEKKS